MALPAKGTPDREVFDAAYAVAAAAPVKQGDKVFATQIPWSKINRLREALDAVSADWKPFR